MVLRKDDAMIPREIADVVFDIGEEYAAQRGNLDFPERDEPSGRCLIELLQAFLVVEDIAEQRVLIGALGLHGVASPLRLL